MTAFTQDDLIALHLSELSPRRSRALRRALALDPALAAESEAIAFTLASFGTAPTPVMDAGLADRTWNAIRPGMLRLPKPSALHLWRVPVTAATGITLTAAAVLWVAVWSNARPSVHTPPLYQASSAPPAVGSSEPGSTDAGEPGQSSPHGSESASEPRQAASAEANQGHRALRAGSQSGNEQAAFAAAVRQRQPMVLAALTPPAGLPLEATQPFDVASLAGSSSSYAIQHPEAALQGSGASSNSKSSRTRKPHDGVESDLSIEGAGSFTLARSTTTTSSSNGASSTETQTQSARPSAIVLATFHQQISPRVGYQVSAGFTHTIFEYGQNATQAGSTILSSGAIQANVYEVSAAYVVQGPRTHRIFTFADAGPGLITFVPKDTTQATGHSLRPSLAAGAGINVRIKHHWSLRAEYRAVFFKGPDFRDHSVSIPFNAQYSVSSQPILGLTYNFNGIRP